VVHEPQLAVLSSDEQVPLQQAWPAPHDSPHWPQLSTSFFRS
jgi:hypothetical protein